MAQTSTTASVEAGIYLFAHTGDGDYAEALEALLKQAAASGATVRCQAGKVYFLSRAASPACAVRLDLNGATLRGAKGVLTGSRTRATYSAGRYFTSVAGQASFTKQPAQDIRAGDILRFESNDTRIATGSYKHGQYTRVLSVSGNAVTLGVPFYASYSVDRIAVLEPLCHRLENGTLDISGAERVSSGMPVTGAYLRGDRIEVARVRVIGGKEAGMGLQLEGMTVVAEDCHVHDVTNISGVPGGGRVGYGIAPLGDMVHIVRPVVERCKHGISSASREFMTRIVKITDAICMTPPQTQGQTAKSQDGVESPLYQAAIDAHANVGYLEVVRANFDGVNTAIAVRNGNALIVDPVIRISGMTTLYRNDIAIIAYEAPVEHLHIRNARMIVASGYNSALPTLVGIQTIGTAAHRAVVVDGAETNAGRLFWMPASGNKTYDSGSSIERLEMRGLRGVVSAGIQINGTVSSPFGTIGRIRLEGDLSLAAGAGNSKPSGFLDIRFVRSVGTVHVRGRLDGAKAQYQDLGLIQIGSVKDSVALPDIDCRGAELYARTMAVMLATTSTVAPGCGRFDDAIITHAKEGAGATYAPGICLNAPKASTEPWSFNGTRISTGTIGLAGSESIRVVKAANASFNGLVTNGGIYPRTLTS